ncbi:MAG: TlpA family protein disulfide reductase [Muribaculaceae bacterium]|nr:TlpA family protein disulfide reductase [Muribaculaceae bacterium]
MLKALRFIIIIIALTSVLVVKADKKEHLSIVNGYFFKNVSPIFNDQGYPEDLLMFSIETPDGNRALGFYSPTINITNELKSLSISTDLIVEGGELLRRFNDFISREKIKREKGSETTKIEVGDYFPDFSATDIDGKIWSNKDIEGKVMVLNQWFTGCKPCRQEMPELSEWKDEMPDVMFFSSTYETPEVAKQVLDKVRFNWIPIVNDTQFCEWVGDRGYPMTIIINKEGKIAMIEFGTSPEKREAIKQTIKSLRKP